MKLVICTSCPLERRKTCTIGRPPASAETATSALPSRSRSPAAMNAPPPKPPRTVVGPRMSAPVAPSRFAPRSCARTGREGVIGDVVAVEVRDSGADGPVKPANGWNDRPVEARLPSLPRA